MSLVKGNWTSFWFETHFNSSKKALLVKKPRKDYCFLWLNSLVRHNLWQNFAARQLLSKARARLLMYREPTFPPLATLSVAPTERLASALIEGLKETGRKNWHNDKSPNLRSINEVLGSLMCLLFTSSGSLVIDTVNLKEPNNKKKVSFSMWFKQTKIKAPVRLPRDYHHLHN